MTFARNVACLVASAAVLAACSKPAAGDATQARASTNTSSGQAVAASDTEMPDMKPGLWEIHLSHTSGDGPARGGVTQQCLDAGAMAASKKTAADYAKANCSKNQTHGGGGTWVSDLVCKTGGSIMTTHSVTTMTGENAYHTDLTTTHDPPIAGRATSTTTMDGKWIGACKPT